METKKGKSLLVNSLARKKKVLIGTLGCLSLAGVLVGGIACDNSSTYGEDGVYYCIVDGKEYQVILSNGVATLVFGEETNSASYEYDGETFTLTLQGEKDPANTKFAGNSLTLEYNGSTYTYLKKVNYTVSYEENGGSEVKDSKVLNGKTLSQPANPTKKGYNFIAWYTDSNFTTPFVFDGTIVTGDITLYARYSEDVIGDTEFTVSFDTLGGNEIADKPTVGGKVYDLPVAAKDGETFLGWWISDTQKATELTCQYTGQKLYANTTLFAVYKSNAPAVSVTEKGVSWNAVSAGASYTVVVTDPNGGTSTSVPSSATTYEYNFATKDAGVYKVEVSVAGGATTTAYYTNKALARVSQFSVAEPAVLVYNAVANATQYYITVECGNSSHTHTTIGNGSFTSFNFANCEMKEGGIVFTVIATAPGYASSVSERFVYNRELAEVGELSYDAEKAEVTWDAVANAAYYKVEVLNNDKTDVYTVGDERTFSLQNYTGETTVKVTPVAFGYNSPAAAETTQTLARLATPANVRQYAGNAGEKIEWDAVAGAKGYKVKIGASVYETTTTIISVPGELLAPGSVYELSVMAVGETEAQNSLWSEVKTVSYQDLNYAVYKKGVVSWNMVAGARNYGVSVNGGKAKTVTGLTSTEVELTKEGENEITVYFYDFYYTELGSITTTVYAHEVAFDVQGGSAVESMYVATGDTIELPTTTRDGRVFAGWYNVPGGPKHNGCEYTSGVYTASYGMTLFAYWTPTPQEITLKVNEGEGSFSETESVLETTATVYYDGTYNLPVPKSSDLAKTFVGWYDKDGNKLTDYKGNSLSVWNGALDGELVAQFMDILEYKLMEGNAGYRVLKAEALNYVEEVKIPAYYNDLPVLEIAPGAFYYCDNLKKISIPDTIQYINIGVGGPTATASAFQFCNGLQEIEVYCPDEENHNTHEVKFADDGNGVLLRVNGGADETDYTYEVYFVPVAKTGDYVVPANVTNIPSNVFNQSKLSKVTVPASVKSVGNNAFAGSKINEIIFEDPTDAVAEDALDFGVKAFANSANLTKVTLPARQLTFSSNDAFDRSIFSNCIRLAEVVMNAGGNYITKDGVVCSQDGLTLVYCPAGYAGDANGVYEIPTSIEYIGDYAFDNCRILKSVVVSGFVRTIGNNAFNSCVALESVVFEGDKDDAALTINSYAFSGCSALREIELPQNLATVKSYAFAGAKRLAYVYFNCAETATFEANAFCDGSVGYVKTVKLGKDVGEIPDFANVFAKCNIEKFEVEANSVAYYSDAKGVLYNADVTTLLYAPYTVYNDGTEATAYEIPSTVTTIATNAFAKRTGMVAMVIPASVTKIETGAFGYCTGLETLTFAARTEALEIAATAFSGCSALTSLDLVEGITTVGNNAFKDCSALEDLKMAASVVNLDPALAFSNCNALATIEIATENESFAAVDNVIYGKTAGVVDTLFLAANMAGEVEVPATVTTIAANAFANKTGVTKVTFAHDGSVAVTFGANAFLNATGIQEIALPAGSTQIANSMFSGCTGLKKITIPASVTLIENLAFKGCSSLTDLNFLPTPAGETAVPLEIEDARSSEVMLATANSPFNGCDSLETVVLPERTTRIGSAAFYKMVGLKKIVIPSTVELIGTYRTNASGTNLEGTSYVFYQCTALEEVIFAAESEEYNPDGTLVSKLTHIGGSSFYGCTALKEISMPDSVKTVGSQLFGGCSGLVTAKISNGITNLASFTLNGKSQTTQNLFAQCTSLKNVTLPENLLVMGTYMFQQCASLEEVTIPELVTKIPQMAFGNTAGLKSVKLPEGLTTIDGNAFFNSGITSITIPASVTTITANAFSGCKDLATITFATDSKLTSIGNTAFKDCGSLEEIVIPEKVTSLGKQAFQNCVSLTSVTLPKGISSLNQTFEGCSSLSTLVVHADSAMDFDAGAGLVLGVNGTKLQFAIACGDNADGVVDIPETITSIGDYAFLGLDWVKEVNIPASVTAIGKGAFQDCGGLETVNFGTDENGNYGIKTIGADAFRSTAGAPKHGLKEIVIPNSVTSVGTNAFQYNPSLKKVVWNTTANIPNYLCSNTPALEVFEINANITSIGTYAFSNAQALKSISLPDSIPTLNQSTFSNCYALESIKLPANIKAIPNSLFTGCWALKSIDLPAGVTSIGNSAFNLCKSLTEFTIPEGVTALGTASVSSVFQGCESLTTIHLPKSLTLIGPSTFSKCYNLVTVTGGENLEAINDRAFENCTSLKSVNFPNATTLHTGMFAGCLELEEVYMPKVNAVHYTGSATEPTYNNQAFMGCSSLHTVVLGALTSIPKETFKGCVSLENFEMPATVTEIGDNAFEGTALKSLTLPEGLTTVGKMAFYGNVDLVTVDIPATLSSIGDGAFANCSSLTGFNIDAANNYYKMDSEIAVTNKAFVGSLFDMNDKLIFFPAANEIDGGILDLSGYDIELGAYAFAGAKNLIGIKLPETLTAIPDYLFAESNLAAIEMKDTVTKIGNYAFQKCRNLTNLAMTDSITEIGQHAFEGCVNLTSVTLPSQLTGIYNYAFANTGLTEVNLPASVVDIGVSAFENTKISSITISSAMESVGQKAFFGTKYLKEINLPESIDTLGAYAFASTAVEKLVIYEVGGTGGGLGSSQIKPGLPGIGGGEGTMDKEGLTGHVFADNLYLTEVTFMGTANLGVSAFSGCTALEKVTFAGDWSANIGATMFEGCTNLKEIVIPETVKTIGAGAFKGCTMESIVIPASVTKMDYTANSGYVFEGWTAEQTIYVCISEAEAAEKYAEGWSGEATVVYNYDPSNTEHSEN